MPAVTCGWSLLHQWGCAPGRTCLYHAVVVSCRLVSSGSTHPTSGPFRYPTWTPATRTAACPRTAPPAPLRSRTVPGPRRSTATCSSRGCRQVHDSTPFQTAAAGVGCRTGRRPARPPAAHPPALIERHAQPDMLFSFRLAESAALSCPPAPGTLPQRPKIRSDPPRRLPRPPMHAHHEIDRSFTALAIGGRFARTPARVLYRPGPDCSRIS